MNGYLSLDFGTTNFKSILYNDVGEFVYALEKQVPTKIDNNCHEQDPLLLLRISELLLEGQVHYALKNNINIKGIGLSAAMHGMIAVGKDGEPVSKLITWSDKRSLKETNWLKQNGLDALIYKNSGTPVHPMLPVAKIIWLKNNDKAIFKNAWKFVSFKEWLLYKWFGTFYVDTGIAAASGLYSFAHKNWNKELLEVLGINESQLGEVVSPRKILNRWGEGILAKFKTNALPPVIVGGADGCLAMLGAGIFEERTGSLTIGTSGAIRTIRKAPGYDSHARTFCYPVDESLYVCGTPVNNGGNVVEWFREQWQMNNDEFWEKFSRSMNDISPGSNGLLFIPYMNGERAPFWDASLRGGFYGLSLSHNKSHLIKALAEGIGFNLAENLDILLGQGNIDTLIADGGFVKSSQWVQLLSDIFNKNICVSDEKSAAARGAALIAKAALENVKNLNDLFNRPVMRNFDPSPERAEAYSILKNRFITTRNKLLESGILRACEV